MALLQEAPRSGSTLAQRTAATGVRGFTSRNVVPPLQRLAAFVNPDLIASWEGGSNQLLVREPGRILERRRMTLTLRPERRTMVWARTELAGRRDRMFANLHASAGLPQKASAELLAAAASAVEWSEGDPLRFGGDLNLRPAGTRPRSRSCAIASAWASRRDRAIDHLLARGLEVVEPPGSRAGGA